MQTEKTKALAASKSGMDRKTARKYATLDKLPSELKVDNTWRTRQDPFTEVWDGVCDLLSLNWGLEAKTIFDDLQRRYPGSFSDGQLRTLQRRIKTYRALEGPPKEVFFPQVHYPGKLCQSDFTDMSQLGITIGGAPFEHLLYHFVLPYSNWETGSVCFSESFESLSEGLQNALWELGGVPRTHQSDRLSAAVENTGSRREFTQSYHALLGHYGLDGRKTNARSPHENGDVEQRHHRLKRAVEQSLLLCGSRDFESRSAYDRFLKKLFSQLNSGRRERFEEELKVLKPLPLQRLDACKRLSFTVRASSTIRVKHNVYSVHSRLIGQDITVKVYAEYLEVWYAQRCIEKIPRLRGEGRHCIQYRHIIDWLVRKPGAFENYRYRSDLFPTHRFRVAYDALKESKGAQADKEYLQILQLAARQSETAVDFALNQFIDQQDPISFERVEAIVRSDQQFPPSRSIAVEAVEIGVYDALLSQWAFQEVVPVIRDEAQAEGRIR
ncbi:MAG: IS21 family transposase [bacterium]